MGYLRGKKRNIISSVMGVWDGKGGPFGTSVGGRNEVISAPPKLSFWQKIKKFSSDAVNNVTNVGEKFFPYNFQTQAEKSIKQGAMEQYPMTDAFAKYVKDQPTNMNPANEGPLAPPRNYGGNWIDPQNILFNRVSEGIKNPVGLMANAVREITGKDVKNSIARKALDRLMGEFEKKKGRVNIVWGVPGVMTHESLHGWFRNKSVNWNEKGLGTKPFHAVINDTWNNLMQDSRIAPILADIDLTLTTPLYGNGSIFQNPQSLANERYAHLGVNPQISQMMNDYPELVDIYGDVMIQMAKPSSIKSLPSINNWTPGKVVDRSKLSLPKNNQY